MRRVLTKAQRVLALDVAALVSGTKYRGEFEERMKNLLRDINNCKVSLYIVFSIFFSPFFTSLSSISISLSVRVLTAQGTIILFIDELHLIIGAGGAEGHAQMDAGNMLKPALARGELHWCDFADFTEFAEYSVSHSDAYPQSVLCVSMGVCL
jgi:ATP-dependent Clp protease ATP-binding subunit ClpB